MSAVAADLGLYFAPCQRLRNRNLLESMAVGTPVLAVRLLHFGIVCSTGRKRIMTDCSKRIAGRVNGYSGKEELDFFARGR